MYRRYHKHFHLPCHRKPFLAILALRHHLLRTCSDVCNFRDCKHGEYRRDFKFQCAGRTRCQSLRFFWFDRKTIKQGSFSFHWKKRVQILKCPSCSRSFSFATFSLSFFLFLFFSSSFPSPSVFSSFPSSSSSFFMFWSIPQCAALRVTIQGPVLISATKTYTNICQPIINWYFCL